MRLYESEAKDLFRQYGIPTPRGELVGTSAELSLAYHAVSTPAEPRVILKAQIAVGKRGKLGAIRVTEGEAAAQRALADLLEGRFAGVTPRSVLVEPYVEIARELYLALTVDDVAGLPLLLFSGAGGGDIEEAAAEDPRRLHRQPIDPRYGLQPYHVRNALCACGVPSRMHPPIIALSRQLYRLMVECEAQLVEINPLAVTADGQILALDGKVILDIYATQESDHPVIRAAARQSGGPDLEGVMLENGVQYVHLGGNVGLVGGGAGVGLLAVDAVDLAGGRAAGFVDLTPALRTSPSRDRPQPVAHAIDYLLRHYEADPGVGAVLVYLSIGSRPVDELGALVTESLERRTCTKPLVFYFGGNSGERARERFRARGFRVAESVSEAAAQAVQVAGNGGVRA